MGCLANGEITTCFAADSIKRKMSADNNILSDHLFIYLFIYC